MNVFGFFRSVCFAIIGGILLLGAGSCRKRSSTGAGDVPMVIAAELRSSGVTALPGLVYRSQADSPIHWQAWTQETFKRAKAANRLVFLVIAMPQHTAYQKVMSEMAGDAVLVSLLNEKYVPVLVDGDASREIGLFTADLAAEIKRPLQLPMFVWLTPSVNPVAWIPVAAGETGSALDLFHKSHAMVIRTWESSPDYVEKNSRLDNQTRRDRFSLRRTPDIACTEPATDVMKAIRQLASLYDPISRSFDESGGLFPSGSIDLLATAVMNPAVPREIRSSSMKTLKELMKDLLPSAMFDPLDGGLFSSRRAGTWAFPVFEREANCQARALVSLFRTYQATRDPLVLERALGVLAFTEKSFATREGLFAFGDSTGTSARPWMWTLQDIQKALPAEDAAWWIAATAMRGLGNLPSEADPTRTFFRNNTLGLVKSMPQIAVELGLTPEAFKPRYEATRRILLKARDARIEARVRDETPHAGTSLRMVSAYAAAFCATGDPAFRDKAVILLDRTRRTFADGPQLWMYAARTAPSLSAGRAFLYGLALQTTLDVAEITGDEIWLTWADDLASTAAERFTATDFLKECSDEEKIIDLPITDLAMLFDDSTAGLISYAECRMAARGRPLVESFSRLAIPLPKFALEKAVLHTDLIQATLVRHHAPLVLIGKDLPEAMKTAVERMPLRVIKRRAATAEDKVPNGSVKIILADGGNRMATTADALQDAILPSEKIE